MTQTIIQGGVTFVVSGVRESEFAGYLNQIAGNPV